MDLIFKSIILYETNFPWVIWPMFSYLVYVQKLSFLTKDWVTKKFWLTKFSNKQAEIICFVFASLRKQYLVGMRVKMYQCVTLSWADSTAMRFALRFIMSSTQTIVAKFLIVYETSFFSQIEIFKFIIRKNFMIILFTTFANVFRLR